MCLFYVTSLVLSLLIQLSEWGHVLQQLHSIYIIFVISGWVCELLDFCQIWKVSGSWSWAGNQDTNYALSLFNYFCGRSSILQLLVYIYMKVFFLKMISHLYLRSYNDIK